MPYIKNTPESLVSRSDSKNPATTCRGITANGLPCRRGLASPSPVSSPPRTAAAQNKNKLRQNIDITAFYCWQHKDQAETIIRRSTWASDQAQKQNRTSIDTLMDRLGVLDINDPQTSPKPTTGNTQYPKKKKQTKHTFCCFTIIEDEGPLPAKPRPARPANQAGKPPQRPHQQMQQVSPHPFANNMKPPSSTQTNPLLTWIPPSLTPATTSLLLAELAKPISAADEPGYIYMFWITPSTSERSAPPPTDIASELLPSAERDVNAAESVEQIKRTDTAIRRARDLDFNAGSTARSAPGGTGAGSGPGTVRLKIGRTSNVTRRLNEWTRQCSNHLTLIRYYPYASGRKPGSAQVGLEPGEKVPHVHRVERLIHLELADIRARDLGACRECGKEHREWFEVAAERAALKRVDECIRRWVRWAQTQK
ncbi:meiotically up-regulated gene 113-domain-containing protein [Aspergillus karnatakaensis]|uniref:uncharacterized protein n=1 Tax=Aspergillus karnatakaensis TaxID=1810916 RepID=UPI003CCD6831